MTTTEAKAAVPAAKTTHTPSVDANKHQGLVDAIARGVMAEIKTEIGKLSEQISKLSVTNNSVLTRLATLESLLDPGTKGSTKSAGAGKTAAKKTTAKGPAKDAESRVTNALLYFRYAMARDLENYRESFGTGPLATQAKKEPSVLKYKEEVDGQAYWSAVAAVVWKGLSEDDKAMIREHHVAWKEGLARDADFPLEEEEASQ